MEKVLWNHWFWITCFLISDVLVPTTFSKSTDETEIKELSGTFEEIYSVNQTEPKLIQSRELLNVGAQFLNKGSGNPEFGANLSREISEGRPELRNKDDFGDSTVPESPTNNTNPVEVAGIPDSGIPDASHNKGTDALSGLPDQPNSTILVNDTNTSDSAVVNPESVDREEMRIDEAEGHASTSDDMSPEDNQNTSSQAGAESDTSYRDGKSMLNAPFLAHVKKDDIRIQNGHDRRRGSLPVSRRLGLLPIDKHRGVSPGDKHRSLPLVDKHRGLPLTEQFKDRIDDKHFNHRRNRIEADKVGNLPIPMVSGSFTPRWFISSSPPAPLSQEELEIEPNQTSDSKPKISKRLGLFPSEDLGQFSPLTDIQSETAGTWNSSARAAGFNTNREQEQNGLKGSANASDTSETDDFNDTSKDLSENSTDLLNIDRDSGSRIKSNQIPVQSIENQTQSEISDGDVGRIGSRLGLAEIHADEVRSRFVRNLTSGRRQEENLRFRGGAETERSLNPDGELDEGRVLFAQEVIKNSLQFEGSGGGKITLEIERKTRTRFLDISNMVGLALGLLVFLLFLSGVAGALMYRKQYMEKRQGERFSNFDSSSFADSDTFNTISYADCAGIEIQKDNSSEELYSLDNDSFLNSLEAITFPETWGTKNTNL